MQAVANPNIVDVQVQATINAARDLRRELKRKYEAKKKERIAEGTKRNYRRIQKIFCERFMVRYFPHVPLAHTLENFLSNPSCANHLRNKEMMENQNVVLLFLQAFPEFCSKDERDLSEATFGNARAAVRDLFYQVGELWKKDSDFEREIQDWCKANARTIAEYRLAGETKANLGKRHMFFDLYQALAKKYFLDGNLFEWAYHVLTWNLMTRGNSTASLRWSHITTGNDSCLFIIPKSKADQEGVKLDPKHVFANTLNPYICPLYALGTYTLCLRKQHPRDVFPGGQQLSRFAKSLAKTKGTTGSIKDLLEAHGYRPDDIGVHSIRKGSGSYAMNGILGQTPSISAICLRTGWTQGAIKDKYLKYEHAQDTYLGRVLAGYPVHGPDCVKFGELPPTFGKNNGNSLVKEAMSVAFPVTDHENFPTSAKGLFHRMLAVVVKNHWWMENVALQLIANHNHPYLSTLFYLQGYPEKLAPLLDEDPTLMTSSGVPGYIETTIDLRRVKDQIKSMMDILLPERDERLLSGIAKILDDRNINAGHVTMSQVRQLFEDRFDSLERRINGCVRGTDGQQRERQRPRTLDNNSNKVRRKGVSPWNEWLHADGAWYVIPPKCKYPNPKSGVLTLLYQYYHGRVLDGTNNNQVIMPVHEMERKNVPPDTKKDDTVVPMVPCTRARKRLSEAKQFVQFLTNNIKHNWPLESDRGYKLPPTKAVMGQMFEHVTEVLRHCAPSRRGPPEKRRKTCNQKGWTTHLRDVRTWKREQRLVGTLSSVRVTIDASTTFT